MRSLDDDLDFCASDVFHDLFSEAPMDFQGSSEGLKYEKREAQEKMAEGVWEAFVKEECAFFEAGTGVGKSLGYLVPSMYWNEKTQERIVISTHTISLQEQLIEKETPFLQTALGSEVHCVLAKGMNNYLCLYKAKQREQSPSLFGQISIDQEELEPILKWSRSTRDGTRSSLPYPLSSSTWSSVAAERQSCLGQKCPEYKSCFFFKARRSAEDAQILLVNHHLLLAHLKGGQKQPILPPFTRLIIDEAHHFLSSARLCLAESMDRVKIFTLLARLHTEAHPETSRLLQLLELTSLKADVELQHLIGLHLIGEKKKLVLLTQKAFETLDELIKSFPVESKRESKWRLTPLFLTSPLWLQTVRPLFDELIQALSDYALSIEQLGNKLEEKKEKEEISAELFLIAKQLQETAAIFTSFFASDPAQYVHWIEKGTTGASLGFTSLEVKEFLKQALFAPLKTIIFCSATLAVEGSFSHFVKELGCEERKRKEAIFPSPFSFQTQAKLLGPSDLPAVSDREFIPQAVEFIKKAVTLTKGGCFILFTSYDMLEQCAERLSTLPYPLFKQGQRPRHLLLEAFKKEKNGVLLGADSFWEGVDVAGKALRLVILTKLPFAVPTTPVAQALSERLKSEGKDPFLEGSLPHAIVKFKQGFGRLIRSSQDRGCIICLDHRLFRSSYSKSFLSSLPPCPHRFAPQAEIYQEMERFYVSQGAYQCS